MTRAVTVEVQIEMPHEGEIKVSFPMAEMGVSPVASYSRAGHSSSTQTRLFAATEELATKPHADSRHKDREAIGGRYRRNVSWGLNDVISKVL